MKNLLLGMAVAVLGVNPALAQYSDDSDLAPRNLQKRTQAPARELRADQIETSELSDREMFQVQVVRDTTRFGTQGVPRLTLKDGKTTWTTNEEGMISGACPTSQGTFTLTAALESDRFRVYGQSGVYQISVDAECGQKTTARMRADSDSGQALGIYQIAAKARTKLEQTVDIRFWSRKIDMRWPADGDYYNWGGVNITRGDYWDVVGHELGHAIYDQAKIGSFGGGPHKIDECYTGSMAISEGWASYFSSWISLDLTDPDARFEYMVPRRAPIHVEHVPTDVCDGPTNEWRAGTFFWDLIDLNSDGEDSKEGFRRVWDALLNSRSRDPAAAFMKLKSSGFDRAVLDIVWQLNFRSKTP